MLCSWASENEAWKINRANQCNFPAQEKFCDLDNFILQFVSMCRKLLESVGKCQKVSEGVRKCPKSPQLFVTYFFQDCAEHYFKTYLKKS